MKKVTVTEDWFISVNGQKIEPTEVVEIDIGMPPIRKQEVVFDISKAKTADLETFRDQVELELKKRYQAPPSDPIEGYSNTDHEHF